MGDIIISGTRQGNPTFTLSARHEVRPVNGLAPELTAAQKAAVLTAVSVRGLGEATAPAETGFPKVAIGIYGFIAGFIAAYALYGRRK